MRHEREAKRREVIYVGKTDAAVGGHFGGQIVGAGAAPFVGLAGRSEPNERAGRDVRPAPRKAPGRWEETNRGHLRRNDKALPRHR